MNHPLYIMVHHSLTADGSTVSWAAIEQYHKVTNAWKDIGYHAGIERVADPAIYGAAAYQALLGRPEFAVAAACPQGDMNRLALHVCVVGNYDLAPPPDVLLERLVERVVAPWMRRYAIPTNKIVGHHDYNPNKTCPGTLFDLHKLRDMAAKV